MRAMQEHLLRAEAQLELRKDIVREDLGPLLGSVHGKGEYL